MSVESDVDTKKDLNPIQDSFIDSLKKQQEVLERWGFWTEPELIQEDLCGDNKASIDQWPK
ncbi:MAG: hypothetical protein Q8N84_02475 [bacterium]|nr:hypothetical protein [bacterium]